VLPIAERALPLPVFFASVSSVKYDRPIAETMTLLIEAEYPAVLISAYDYAQSKAPEQKEIRRLATTAADRGIVLLVDSGRYESFWLRDTSWDRTDFLAAIRDLKPPLAFSFDAPIDSNDAAEVARDAVERATADQMDLPDTTVLPIVHGAPSVLPAAVAEVASLMAPLAVALPERELGEGLLARAATLRRTTGALKDAKVAIPLHLLGTGDPLSILVYAAMGADSFDGLEWCHTVVNFDDASLHHLQHLDLFVSQSGVDVVDGLFLEAAQAHNLVFLIDWLRRIRDASDDQLTEMILRYVPGPGRSAIAKALSGTDK
jgi:queuine/archaeosine tRNA-ribosyltransferase